MPAPIVLFVYNRPHHTNKTIEALRKNLLAGESTLYIFADGPKKNDPETLAKISKVNEIIQAVSGFREVIITKRKNNIGLAANIEDGVTSVVNQHGKVIVLEDDIVTSPGFLTYMNNALDLYEHMDKVMHISGYMYPHKHELPETFFFDVPLCWGWGTWKRAWQHYNTDSISLWKQCVEKDTWNKYEKFGGSYLRLQLAHNITGRLRTWFVKWHSSVYLKDGITLYPNTSLVDNIGFDNSGVHNGEHAEFNHERLAGKINVSQTELKVNEKAAEIIRDFYKPFTSYIEKSFAKKIKNRIRDLYRRVINKLLPKYKSIVFENEIVNSFFGEHTKVYPITKLRNAIIGNYTYIADDCILNNTIVGKFCSIGPHLVSGWGIHPMNGISTHPMFYSPRKQNGMTLSKVDKIQENKIVTIGNDVFIGMNVSILDGITIGHGAAIGAGAVVSKDIPPYAIAVGCPIKVIGYRFDEETRAKLLEKKWWDYDKADLSEIEKNFFDIDEFLKSNPATVSR